jgi:DNA invertase Pin-like site-specific DNA recombinase
VLVGVVSTCSVTRYLQCDAMMREGVERVFLDEGVSGASADRPGLQKALDYCRPGDTFGVWRLDRLGRNLTHVRNTSQDLREKGVHFRSITEGLTDEGAMGKTMIDIPGAFAEFERNSMLERTQAGLAAARARGSKGGRRKLLDDSKVAELKTLRGQGFSVPAGGDVPHLGAIRLPLPERMSLAVASFHRRQEAGV